MFLTLLPKISQFISLNMPKISCFYADHKFWLMNCSAIDTFQNGNQISCSKGNTIVFLHLTVSLDKIHQTVRYDSDACRIFFRCTLLFSQDSQPPYRVIDAAGKAKNTIMHLII